MPRFPPLRIAPALLVSFAGLAVLELWQLAHVAGPVRTDFFGLWAWSRYVAENGAVGLYDAARQHGYQAGLDPRWTDTYYPFLYPPTYLLAIWPLGHLSYGAARLLWSAATLAAYLAALAGRREAMTLAVVAPATVLCLICGQNGLLTAALLLGGLRLAPGKPWLAGALLGLLAIKPHLALLVPVALVAAGLWRTALAAAASATSLVLCSAAAFGVAPWRDWIAASAAAWSAVDGFIAERSALVPTVSAALRQLGAAPPLVVIGQITAALAAAAAVWLAWRSGGSRRLLALPVATLLATPYAFLYDLPVVSGAALLLTSSQPRPAGAGVLAAALLLPQLMFDGLGAALPLAAPVLALVLAWALIGPRDRPAALA